MKEKGKIKIGIPNALHSASIFPGEGYRSCILCGDEPFVIGIFVPNSKSKGEFCCPDNKERCIFYTLCEKCYKQPEKDRTEKVENKLKSMMKEMRSRKEKEEERR